MTDVWTLREQRWKNQIGHDDVSYQVGIGDPEGKAGEGTWQTLTTLYDKAAARSIVRDHNLMLPTLSLLWAMRIGDCWCPCGIDDPRMRGQHDTTCTMIQGLFSILADEYGIAFPLDKSPGNAV